MPLIILKTRIKAPIERIFDLSRSVDLHLKSAGDTDEQSVGAGADGADGLLENGEKVTWKGSHFGLRHTLQVRIAQMERPKTFTDEMIHGPFARLTHRHHFALDEKGATIMTDEFDYKSRGGPLGWMIENSFLTAHLRRFLAERNKVIKRVAQSDDEWREYLPHDSLQD